MIKIHTYLHPKLSNLSDPFLLENVELAVRRIWEAKIKIMFLYLVTSI